MGFQKACDRNYIPVVNGVTRKTLAVGAKTLLAEFALEQGSDLPAHSHPHEQTGYLVRGRLKLRIDETEYDVLTGDAWTVPGGTVHSAYAVEDSIAVEVFSPLREDYLP